MVGQTQPEHAGKDIEQSQVLRREETERQVDESKEEERVEGIGLGDDGLRPERSRESVQQGARVSAHAVAQKGAYDEPHHDAGERAQERAQEVDPEGDRSDRQQREEPAEQGVQRITGRMVDAQEVGRHDEEAIVLEGHRARRAVGVQAEERDENDHEVGPLLLQAHPRNVRPDGERGRHAPDYRWLGRVTVGGLVRWPPIAFASSSA